MGIHFQERDLFWDIQWTFYLTVFGNRDGLKVDFKRLINNSLQKNEIILMMDFFMWPILFIVVWGHL